MTTVSKLKQDRELLEHELKQAGAVITGDSVRCPFHDDTNPSGGIYQNGNGWKYKCHGCGFGGDLFDVRAKVQGVDVRSILKDANGNNGATKVKRKRIAIHDYKDEKGEIVYHIDRFNYEPKCQPRLPGAKTYGIGRTKRILYNLDKLVASDGESILIAEGEKCCDILVKHGKIATCNPFGSKKWKSEYNQFFKGKRVFICEDNDPPGRDHSKQVAVNLWGIAAKIQIIHFYDMPEGYDVYDFITDKGFPEFQRYAKLNAETYNGLQAEDKETSQADTKPATVETLDILRGDSIHIKPVDWLWGERILRGGINLLVGRQNQGKSLAAVDIAARTTKGGPWPDDEQQRQGDPGGVLWITSEENREDTLLPRFLAAGGDRAKLFLSNAIVKTEYSDGDKTTSSIRGLVYDKHIHLLEKHVSENNISLLVLDTLNSFIGDRSGNSDSDVRGVLSLLNQMAEKYDVAILGINHFNKNSAAPNADRVTGSRAWSAAPRMIWEICRPEPGNPESDDPLLRYMLLFKSNVTAQENRGLKFHICPTYVRDDQNDTSVEIVSVEWLPEAIQETSDQYHYQLSSKAAPKTEDAASDLYNLLKDGPRESIEVEGMMKDIGHTHYVIHQAKKKLGAVSKKKGFGKESVNYWELKG